MLNERVRVTVRRFVAGPILSMSVFSCTRAGAVSGLRPTGGSQDYGIVKRLDLLSRESGGSPCLFLL